MKVALCFFGQPRLLDNPHTYNSHLSQIINKYSTDVYVHNWIAEEGTQFTYSDWASDKMQEDWKDKQPQDLTSKVASMYNPVAAKFDTVKMFKLQDENREIVSTLPFYSTNNENNLMAQIYSISECIKLVQDSIYDFVILSRYDNYIFNLPDLNTLNTDGFYITDKYAHFADVVLLGGVQQMKALACFHRINDLSKKVQMFIPEEFKRAALYENGFVETRIGIDAGIARTLTMDYIQK